MNRKNKVALMFMVLLGGLIFWHEGRETNFYQVVQGLAHLQWDWLLVAVLLMFLSFVAEAAVLRTLIEKKGEPKQPRWNLLRIPPIQAVFNAITPFSSGGQPAQLIALLQIGYEGGRASSVLLMKFIIYQLMILINFILTMLVGFHEVVVQFHGLAWLIAFGFIIHVVTIGTLLMIMFYYRLTKAITKGFFHLLAKLFKTPKIQQCSDLAMLKIESFHQESLQLKREKRKVFKAAALTLVQLLTYYLIPYFVLLALHLSDVNLLTVFSMHVMIVMITSIFPVPGGAGGAEYSFKTLFSLFIPNASLLILGMFLWRFITFYLGMILGMIAMAIAPKHQKKSE
ncbi:membrane protein [Lapidilactobacillus concavus DSM 17758]|uniref:Phosphatidylglycerol lysyltransferase n=1 Tax=Lapidilactobacillus concavus DSM 17758 TaxID=1423735 RepID=A0A0R1W555_9LACO|nr:lysylphosphatidylglycerol synthase transmembrane domain-containing protein [Lapidilactobacillus concavus]KRM12894.1 membrane protein [Lapidilactobacillus concavus DSM 17758]GEL13217.1 phosphatidylglycerol lysyltransferase [Lapidilactobacillus concavus]